MSSLSDKVTFFVHPFYYLKDEAASRSGIFNPHELPCDIYSEIRIRYADSSFPELKAEYGKFKEEIDQRIERYIAGLEEAKDGRLVFLRASDPYDYYLQAEKYLFQYAKEKFGNRLIINPSFGEECSPNEYLTKSVVDFLGKIDVTKTQFNLFGEYTTNCVVMAAFDILSNFHPQNPPVIQIDYCCDSGSGEEPDSIEIVTQAINNSFSNEDRITSVNIAQGLISTPEGDILIKKK